jgi:hypothetical protein
VTAQLEIVPVTFRQAAAFVAIHHRHHRTPPRGYRFCLGVATDERLDGVASVGQSVATMTTAEHSK